MLNFTIHIGTPRTGTTVLQKSAFPKCKNHLVFMKKAYKTTGTSIDNKRPYLIGANPDKLMEKLSGIDPKDNPFDFFNSFIAMPSIMASQKQLLAKSSQQYDAILVSAVQKIRNTSIEEKKSILISSERLIDTAASLTCKSNHSTDYSFGYIKICEAITQALSVPPSISVCIREPIGYLRSKYVRTFFQRRAMKSHRDLSPSEYIAKQAALESRYPGTSAIIHAMHADLIKQLQKYGLVRAFGFKELLSSDNIFSLMGLQGEDKYAFRNFPRENKLPFTKEQELAIEKEITQALKRFGLYGRIMNAQMFE